MRLNFFEIKTIKSDQLNKKLSKFLNSIKRKLDKFFEIEVKKPLVFFVNSRKEIDKIWDEKTESWFVGWSGRNFGNIFILNPKVYTKESTHKNIKSFWQVLAHEYCHLYFWRITRNGNPTWLNEGLACYLAGQTKKRLPNKNLFEVFGYYSKGGKSVYNISYFWVKFLLKKFGEKKLLNLIKSINYKTTQKEFAKNFRKIYGINYSKKDFGKLVSK